MSQAQNNDLIAQWKRAELMRLGSILEQIGEEEVAGIKQDLSRPVERIGDIVIRSVAGEFPRLEFGKLQAGIEYNVDVGGDAVTLEVMASREGSGDVPAQLELEMHRKILGPSFEEVSRELPAAFIEQE